MRKQMENLNLDDLIERMKNSTRYDDIIIINGSTGDIERSTIQEYSRIKLLAQCIENLKSCHKGMLIDLNSAFGIDNDPDQDAVTHIRAGTNTYDIHMRSIKGYDIVTVKYVNLADQRSESTSSIADSLMLTITPSKQSKNGVSDKNGRSSHFDFSTFLSQEENVRRKEPTPSGDDEDFYIRDGEHGKHREAAIAIETSQQFQIDQEVDDDTETNRVTPTQETEHNEFGDGYFAHPSSREHNEIHDDNNLCGEIGLDIEEYAQLNSSPVAMIENNSEDNQNEIDGYSHATSSGVIPEIFETNNARPSEELINQLTPQKLNSVAATIEGATNFLSDNAKSGKNSSLDDEKIYADLGSGLMLSEADISAIKDEEIRDIIIDIPMHEFEMARKGVVSQMKKRCAANMRKPDEEEEYDSETEMYDGLQRNIGGKNKFFKDLEIGQTKKTKKTKELQGDLYSESEQDDIIEDAVEDNDIVEHDFSDPDQPSTSKRTRERNKIDEMFRKRTSTAKVKLSSYLGASKNSATGKKSKFVEPIRDSSEIASEDNVPLEAYMNIDENEDDIDEGEWNSKKKASKDFQDKEFESLMRKRIPNIVNSDEDEQSDESFLDEYAPKTRSRFKKEPSKIKQEASSSRKRKRNLSHSSNETITVGDSPASSAPSDDDDLILPKEWQTSNITRRTRSQTKVEKTMEKGKKKRKFSSITTKKPSKKPSKKKPRVINSESEEDEGSTQNTEPEGTDKEKEDGKKQRFRRILSGKELKKSTQDAEKAERERRLRLAERQKEFNGIEVIAENDSTGEVQLTYQNSSQRRCIKKLELDPGVKEELPPVQVDDRFLNFLKKHQAEGIQFLYETCIESIERLVNHGDLGGGGILAHCMGLGKTLQVIVFLYTIMMHQTIKEHINRVMIIVPKNVVLNWQSEFQKWLYDVDPTLDTLSICELDSSKTVEDRLDVCKQWHNSYSLHRKPSVLIIGYEMYVNLVASQQEREEARKKSKRQKPLKPKKISPNEKKLEKNRPKFREYLQEGPHLLICDEGHKLKNDKTLISITMWKIATRRRIFLTGTPMQNNLKEYHCMIDYIRPGLLGDKKEFQNRYSNVIERGRSKDATPFEVKCMQRRCHVLYKKLDRVLHRRDYRYLVSAIPEKQEYVIFVSLTKPQIDLYRSFLENFCANLDANAMRRKLLAYSHIFARIYNHPYLLYAREQFEQRKKMLREEAEEDENFVVSDDDDEEPDEKDDEDNDDNEINDDGENTDNPSTSKCNETKRRGPKTRSKAKASIDDLDDEDSDTPIEMVGWYRDTGLVSSDDKNKFELSNKIVLLTQIIKHCEQIGDKLLIFSKSIECLSLIERMLKTLYQTNNWFVDGHEALNGNEQWGWIKDLDYFVITGETSGLKRATIQDRFNDLSDLRARLMLISTRAGSLGTNLVAANRVVIFDCSWNPSHDTQSLFRVYRFGQDKPVYIYRFVAQGTIEQRIYSRDVTKESIAHRVVDEKIAIDRHFTEAELQEYYKFNPDESITDEQNTSDEQQNSSQGGQVRPSGVTMRLGPPKDRLLGKIFLSHENCVVNYKRHDTLFDEIDEDKLTEAERTEAWEEFDREIQKGQKPPQPPQIQEQDNTQQLQIEQQSPPELIRQSLLHIPGMTQQIIGDILAAREFMNQIITIYIDHQKRGGIHNFEMYFYEIFGKYSNPKSLWNQILQGLYVTMERAHELCSSTWNPQQIDNFAILVARIKQRLPEVFALSPLLNGFLQDGLAANGSGNDAEIENSVDTGDDDSIQMIE